MDDLGSELAGVEILGYRSVASLNAVPGAETSEKWFMEAGEIVGVVKFL